jgi:acyl-CoA synthetase
VSTIAQTIEDNALDRPDGTAFLTGARRLTWSGYASRSDALADLLCSLGLKPGERMALLLPDGPGVHVAFVATEKAGLVAVGIGARAGRSEIEHLLHTSGAVALLCPARYRGIDMEALVATVRQRSGLLRHHIAVEPDDDFGGPVSVDGQRTTLPRATPELPGKIAERRLGPGDLWLLNSTSGTTGLPKCVGHDQARWFFFHQLAVRAARLGPADIFMSAVPAPFGFGLWTAHFTPAILGAPTVVLDGFSAEEALGALEAHRVSILAAVSTQFILLLDSPAMEQTDLRALRVLFTGGEKVPYERAARFEEATGAHVLQFYGSNETGALSGTTLADPQEKRLTTAGRPIPEMQVRLFDDEGNDVTTSGRGQPGCKGGTLSLGYFGNEAANRELIRPDGWFLIGDRVSIDADGYLTVEGRLGDFIIRGGKNISAAGVEEAIERHPDITVAAAIPVPDPIFGERVCAYVELRPGTDITLEALLVFLEGEGTSKEYLPERLVVPGELPRSSGGKIARQSLREDAVRRAEAGEWETPERT